MKKKFLAPLVFGILSVAGIAAYWLIFLDIFKTPLAIAVYAVAVIALSVAMFFTLKARYKELDQEDEEELKKY